MVTSFVCLPANSASWADSRLFPPTPSPKTGGNPDLTSQLAQATSEPLIPVKKIAIVGSTVFSDEQLQVLVAPLLNRSVTLVELQELANKVTKLYQENNYITSRAVLPADQDINDGEIVIQVIEGKLERIDIKKDESARLSEDYIRDRIAPAVTVPLNFARIEEELQLLRNDPLIAEIKANLSAGEGGGSSILEVTVKEAKLLNLGLSLDNYGNSATGIYRFGVTPQLLNLSGIGDRLAANYTRSGSADAFSFDYQLPLNPKGGTLGLSFAFDRNPAKITAINSPATIDIRADTQIYELNYRQPLVRTLREEFALSFGLAIEQSSFFVEGIPFNLQTGNSNDGGSQATILQFGQDFISRDPGGAWAFRSLFNFGIDALGATVRNDAPDGRFFAWNGQVLRVQRLGSDRDTLALLRLSAQLTGDSLLPPNRFSVGGPQSVRGYRQNQITGDSGIQGSLEFQFPVVRDNEGTSILKILPFIEAGTVWNANGETSGLSQTIVGFGTGLLWQPSRNFTIRIDYGIPLIKINNSSSPNNLQDSGLYFSLSTNL
ncbi:ShlB/FhaC/HecB family hemolysin secretion/activation protein [Pseudanabaena sp. PCC 6802]|uniref:ShlB/FhaC/HecB family hemolysin secretion/activation protein n=1 Tax=Pseudanabaena sp. PCC 6802 TaxID=118173 RepID=UPI00037C678A|nr:ShlB/FhaC/HecB family hemolysin secretion/activation protein [Pseudanabaena sp. PCC 6802]